MSPIARVLMAVLVLSTAGCVDLNMVVRVQADGSGVVTERVLVNSALVASLRALHERFRGSEGSAPAAPFSLLDPEKLRARAADMGPGVTLLEARETRSKDAEGYLVRYGFEDISTLRINQNPGRRAPATGGGRDGGDAPAADEYIHFEFQPGEEAVLVIHKPAPRQRESARAPRRAWPEGAEREAQLARLRALLQGLRVAVAVEVDGMILETDASHVDGARITLTEIDFDRILSAPEYLERLTEDPPRSIEEAKALLEDFPGIAVELASEVTVRFRGFGLRAI